MPTNSPVEAKDVVQEARELLETHSIVAMRVNKPYREIRPLITALCDEVERLRKLHDYTSHADGCEWWGSIPRTTCTCGLETEDKPKPND